MKKRLLACTLAVMTLLSFTACGKFKCDLCGQEKSGKKYEYEFLGQKGTICKDCHDDLQDLKDGLGSLFD